MENEDFWVHFLKMVPKWLKKHYLEKVSATRFQNVENPYKTNGKWVFKNAKKRCKKPYKTNGTLMILSKKWKMDSRIITFLTVLLSFGTRKFAKSKNLIKPMENSLFHKSKNRSKKAYKTNRILALFGPKSEKGLQKHWKSIS